MASLDLTGANLTGTVLFQANLAGANLIRTRIGGAIWSGTTCPDGTNSNNDGGTCKNNLG